MTNSILTKPLFIAFKTLDGEDLYINANSIERMEKYLVKTDDDKSTEYRYSIRLNSKKEYTVSTIVFGNILKKLGL